MPGTARTGYREAIRATSSVVASRRRDVGRRAVPVNEDGTGARTIGIASSGHAVFAATMVILGILGLIQGNFTPTWSGVPKSFPAREALAYVCASISLAAGIGLLWHHSSIVASRVLLTYLFSWLLLFRVS